MSTSEPTLSHFHTELTTKQSELLARCPIGALEIDLKINPIGYALSFPCSVDVEHDEFGNMVCIGFYDGHSAICYTDISMVPSLVGASLIGHNGLSDIECLRSWGINVKDNQLVWDTMLLGHILDSSLKSYGLKDMAKREFGISYPSYDDIVGKRGLKTSRITLDKQPMELVAAYNAMDCYVTYKLWEKQISRGVEGEQQRNLGESETQSGPVRYYNEVEKPAAKVFAAMETRGIRVDLDYLKSLQNDLEAAQKPIKEAIINELGPINLNSPKQLLEALNGKGITPYFKGKPSTDKRALSIYQNTHQDPLLAQLLEFSEVETLLTSFVRPYLERGQEIVHPFFNQCGTRTGRPSCSNPNLLQIPRRTDNGKLVRRMFVPRSGMLMGDCDFGQIEPRVLAHLSKDPNLCRLFNDKIDFHQFTADKLGISRERAKILNLSVGYRATFKSVSQQLKCSDSEAQNEIDAWWSLFPTLRRWQDRLIYDSKRSGYCTTLLGRRIRVDDLGHGNQWRREGAERQLINNITQGSAAEIMKMAMIHLSQDARLSPSFGLLVQVYDELVWESPDAENDINYVVENMKNAVKLLVPLTVDAKIGLNWSECH